MVRYDRTTRRRPVDAISDRALGMLKVDGNGFDAMDRRLLMAVIEKFDGGPVGVDSLAAAIGEERGTIEDVLEPFLIQQGLVQRTPRGRQAMPLSSSMPWPPASCVRWRCPCGASRSRREDSTPARPID